MLKFPYHLRYELVEFVVYLLATRIQQLVSMHAACVGHNGRGVLLIGASGAGKSTIALHCMRAGMDFLTEDSVSVRPDNLLATGVANFLHLRIGADYFLNSVPSWIRKSPIIERRSGVRKLEIDLRKTNFKLAAAPLKISAVVFLSSKALRRKRLLEPLNNATSIHQLQSTQPYAATQPGWGKFIAGISRLDSYVLYRAEHPSSQVAAIESLLR